MKFKSFLKVHLPVLVMVIVFLTSFVWGAGSEKTAVERPGVHILTHDDIIRSGARDLADLLIRIPGIRVSTNRSQGMPSAGPLVSSDSPVRLSANQFSRVLILFNGHTLNKNWHGGANQDWGTGFLEGLKEVRVYTGPAAAAWNGWNGGMDMIVDLVPFDGVDQGGAFDIRLTQSFSEDRADKSLLHLRTGNRWGEDGRFSFFADVTRWAGADVIEGWSSPGLGERMGRKDPTFQVGAMFEKGRYDLTARHLQHYHFDPNYCGRKWSYTFAEASRTFDFPAGWEMKITGSVDHIISRWGLASSAEGEARGDWDKVKELRLSLRAGLNREFKRTSVFIGADYQNVRIDGGPDRIGDYASVMNFSTRRNIGGGVLRMVQRFSDVWSLRGVLRVEKAEGYSDTAFLPELSLFYKRGNTQFGLGYAVGHRYMDSWFRVGSGSYTPDNTKTPMPYIVPVELKPERNGQLRAWLEQGFGGLWVFRADAFIGKYSHLMGLDWDYAFEQQFSRLRAMEVGNYSYWGGSCSVDYKGKRLSAGASVSFQGVTDSELTPRQLYVSEQGDRPLFLPPTTANVFIDWTLLRKVSLYAGFSTFGASRNAGVDLSSPTLDTVFNAGIFKDTSSYSNLDVSLRIFDLWKGFEIQLSVHNALNDHVRLPMLEGGTFLSRGRELTLTLRQRL